MTLSTNAPWPHGTDDLCRQAEEQFNAVSTALNQEVAAHEATRALGDALAVAVEAYHAQFKVVAQQTDAEFETDGTVLKEQMRRHADMMVAARAWRAAREG